MPLSYKVDREKTLVLFYFYFLTILGWIIGSLHAHHNDTPIQFYLSPAIFF